MTIWFKIYADAHLIRTETIEDDGQDTRTHKIFRALEEACQRFDLGKPIWKKLMLTTLNCRCSMMINKLRQNIKIF